MWSASRSSLPPPRRCCCSRWRAPHRTFHLLDAPSWPRLTRPSILTLRAQHDGWPGQTLAIAVAIARAAITGTAARQRIRTRHGAEGHALAWIYLVVAGLMEIGWAIGLKYTEGFSRLLPSIGTAFCIVFSMVFLGLALKTLPVGTAYAVWTGIGAVGTALLGIYLFDEPATVLRLGCIGLIFTGIIGLKLVT